jgi:hypothetical protein
VRAQAARGEARRKRDELRERRKSGNAIERRPEVSTRESTSGNRTEWSAPKGPRRRRGVHMTSGGNAHVKQATLLMERDTAVAVAMSGGM